MLLYGTKVVARSKAQLPGVNAAERNCFCRENISACILPDVGAERGFSVPRNYLFSQVLPLYEPIDIGWY